MEDKKLENLFYDLSAATEEAVRPGFADDIKRRIPGNLRPAKRGIHTISVVIDLRVNKLTAAAVIILATILGARFFGGQYFSGDNLYQDSRMLIRYCLGGAKVDSSQAVRDLSGLYEQIRSQGKDVAYYGNIVERANKNSVLLHWKLDDGNYRVIFGDFSEKTVNAEQLIKLQSQMLQEKTK